MTDKQIIIDGVDVSGCACMIEDYYYQQANNLENGYKHIKNVCELGESGSEYYKLFCKDNPNCYYKQLQRKEQELQEAMDNYVQLDLQRVKEYNELVDLYKDKEQECKEKQKTAQDAISELCAEKSTLYNELDQLKRTLTEIKPILEIYANTKVGEEQLDGTSQVVIENSGVLGSICLKFDPNPARQALQKISEVLNDR